MNAPYFPRNTTFMERIHFEPMSGCWIWGSSVDGKGYGQYWDGSGKKIRAHRFSYESKFGKIPNDLELDHKCRNRSCVNPDHLEPVTHKVNTLRGTSPSAMNSVKTSCRKGHIYDQANTRLSINGSRSCRECDRHYHESMRRANGVQVKKVVTECPHGHEYSVENTRIVKSGARQCRKCDQIRQYAKRHRAIGSD